jgi:GAF domain-containing protein
VLADSDTLADAGPQILEAICEALEWDFGALWVIGPSADELRLAQLWRRPDQRLDPFEEASRAHTFRRGIGLPGRVWASRRPAWIRDVVVDDNFPRATVALVSGLHGAVGFPVIVHGEIFAALEFFSHEIHEPDNELLEMMAVIGAQVGRLIEREQMERRLQFNAALLESQGEAAIDGTIVVSTDSEVLHWNKRFRELWGIPETLMRGGDFDALIEHMARKTVDPDVFKRVAEEVTEDPTAARRDEFVLTDGRVIDRWTAPVRGKDGLLFGRALYFSDITEQKATEQRLRDNERWYAFLAEVTSLLSQTLNYTASLTQLARRAVPILGDWCTIHVIETSGDIRPLAVAHSDPRKTEAVRRLQDQYPIDPQAERGLAEVARTGTSQLYEDVPDDILQLGAHSEQHVEELRALGFRSAMIVPLVCRDRVLGTLTLVSAESGRRYTRADLRRAEDLATRAAFPVDNARLYQERALVAQTLQRSLLPPQMPPIPGVELAARYHSAAESADVGGDFYDLFRAGTRTWGLFLGDVSGKGVEAATVTALARHTLRTATMATQRPSEILSMLNAALLEQTEPDRFCTAVFAIIEPRFGGLDVRIASGGHPLPYLVRSAGTLEPVPCEGTLLGVVADPELQDVSIELDFGDKLILYTDGILDVRPRDARFGQQELEELFAACAKRGVRSSADLIERTVLDLQGGQARDDFALVIFGVRASIFRRVRTPRLWSRSAPERT